LLDGNIGRFSILSKHEAVFQHGIAIQVDLEEQQTWCYSDPNPWSDIDDDDDDRGGVGVGAIFFKSFTTKLSGRFISDAATLPGIMKQTKRLSKVPCPRVEDKMSI
jgi:hypothetical protein